MKDKPPELKVVDFDRAKAEADKPPEFLLEKIQQLNDMAVNGKLRSVLLHYDYENDESDMQGGTMMWHYSGNALELLGLAEVIKSVALDFTLESMHSHEYEEE